MHFRELFISIYSINFEIFVGFFVLTLLLIFSFFISGAESAYFSINPKDIKIVKHQHTKRNKTILRLLVNPLKLLFTIINASTLTSISIIILSLFLSDKVFNFAEFNIKIIFEVIVLSSFVIFIFNIFPKIFAFRFQNFFLRRMAYPLFFMAKIFKPLNSLLILLLSFINKKFQKKQAISLEYLSNAIDTENNTESQERDILEGIVKFGSIDVKEIMTPRIDITAVDIDTDFSTLKNLIVENEFSRIPVYKETFDNIKGILFIKDLIEHIDKEHFIWSEIIREAYFVPETKKIDDLFQEFKKMKIHMAVVSDEYGGICGIVTLEDIMEQIVGEINDEFDIDEVTFKKIDDNTYIFEGKTQLNDFYKILQTEDDFFDEKKGDAETLAGLILELKGDFPVKGEKIECKNFSFFIESVDNRKINRIKVLISK